jgi:hypothetical protein
LIRRPTPLTKLGGCAYSPTFVDDDTVVFDLTRDGMVDLYRLDLDGGVPLRLTSDPGWEWRSSRGANDHEVVFIRQTDDMTAIETLDLESGVRAIIAGSGGAPVFAGDAYYHSPGNTSELRRLRDGRDDVFLHAPPGKIIDTIAASPDGGHLAMILFGDRALPTLCTVDLASVELGCTDVETSSARVAFSSSSDAIYFDDHDAISRIPRDGGRVTRVIPEAQAVGGIAVAPSGRVLVYSDCGAHTDLISVLDGPEPFVGETDVSFPAFGPEGLLAYARINRRAASIVVRDPTGASREVVLRDKARFTAISFSADGTALVFVVADPVAPGIYLAYVGSAGAANRLTEDPADDSPFFVGDAIYFTRRNQDGVPVVMRMQRDGSGLTPAHPRPRITLGADLSRGRLLLAAPAFDFYYWWDPAKGAETPGPKVAAGGRPSDIAVSPNGDWVASLGGISGHDIWRAESSAGAEAVLVHRLPEDQSSLAITIDDRGHPLVAIDRWAGELWQVPAAIGAPW